ncbi:6-chlorohydroxyquinol-1,2-dioxygenase [Nocardia sp. NEAU-G5]|uniref:6-chlorohydroxyquinol-1,2-dioxygenase n=1 Tax=Nocardia albiluteola TaxID=2842303 RepID=A0ABS6AWD0_9NOCA|nr:dioxygenase [Nocardia albiluteola]MBU3062360.1 6-chlorohydroxyquinol-1,2-dioxygenase [Nocardia albiluteola]
MELTEHTTTAAVQASFAATPDDRLRTVMTALTAHLHAFVRDVRPTHEEWEQAIEFLTEVGHTCTDTRQEFVLLSDVLGVSALVETINGDEAGATENTVLGPFHATVSPPRALGDTIDMLGEGTPCVVTGRVLGVDGTPLGAAVIDVWQCDKNGFYDVQQPDRQPAGNGRGLFHTAADGRYWFRTVVPSHYPVPDDGPVGQLLHATARHPYRPAHIHFIAEAPGHRPVTTHVFVADSPYIDGDTVFAVRDSLIRVFAESDDAVRAESLGTTAPFRHVEFDIVLAESDGTR